MALGLLELIIVAPLVAVVIVVVVSLTRSMRGPESRPWSLLARTIAFAVPLGAVAALIIWMVWWCHARYGGSDDPSMLATFAVLQLTAYGIGAFAVAGDARRRGSQNVALIAIAAVVFGPLTWVVYLATRPKGYVAPCASCRREILETLDKCPLCRAPLAATAAPAPKAMADFLATAAAPGATAIDPGQTLAKGAMLGPYRVLEPIGKGGMGAVYRAEHEMLGRTVALKILPRALAGDPEFVERFKREAQVLAKLRHPNIVEVHDLGVAGDTYYFAMEFVEGTTLRSVLAAKALGPDRALAMVPKLCDALEAAHAQGVIHRDIKPENILIDGSGEPKIADFGLARIIRGPTLTMTQAVMGTPDYMAPEQRESTKDVDHRADIYSLGVVLYEMLTGSLPIGNFEPPAKRAPVDGRVDPIVMKALEYDRARRYERAAHMGTDIRRVTTTGVNVSRS
jgi:predicted Ser/Thr protein kinase